MRIFYRPEDGVAADVIPFFWNGTYHLFYLKDYRDPQQHGEGTPWWHLVTRDFVRFDDCGEALPRGSIGTQDVWVFTGSVVERRGIFHIFYTGHNGHLKHVGRPVQAVMHATSPDMRTWTKDREMMFFAPPGYEKDDWRDPFVFWNADASEYWMLLAARKTSGPGQRRGCVALAASKNLRDWEVRDPFWAPDEYYTHECPDVFRIGDWWYLVYSTFSERCVTHYRMSKSLSGPWLAPANDTFDGRAFYAAKTAGDGQRRFVFGWLPTREGEKDDGGWQWGGDIVAHEVLQRRDGTLAVRMPATVEARFARPLPLSPHAVLGEWEVKNDAARAFAFGRFSAALLGDMPNECMIDASVTFSQATYNCGLLLRADTELDKQCYQIRLEPANQRMVIDRLGRPGDQPFLLERALPLSPDRPVRLRVIADGTCLVVYADDEVALSCRMYDRRGTSWGVFVTEGEARFDGLAITARG